MVCSDCMRLTILPSEFEFFQMRKKHRGGRGTWKAPLQKMNLEALVFTRDWKNELRVAARRLCHSGVCWIWDHGAKRLRIGCMTKTPYILDLLGGELKGLGNVDIC